MFDDIPAVSNPNLSLRKRRTAAIKKTVSKDDAAASSSVAPKRVRHDPRAAELFPGDDDQAMQDAEAGALAMAEEEALFGTNTSLKQMDTTSNASNEENASDDPNTGRPHSFVAHTPITPSRASALKATLTQTHPIHNSHTGLKNLPDPDSENAQIALLRSQSHSWSTIASTLNNARITAGLPPTLTPTSVYARHVRGPPKVALLKGQPEFDPKAFMHIRPKKRTAGEPIKRQRFEGGQDELLVRCYVECQEAFWSRVAELLEDKSGMPFTAEDCYQRWEEL